MRNNEKVKAIWISPRGRGDIGEHKVEVGR
jgi:hypothetical protein